VSTDPKKTDAFETVFTRTTAGYFLREFCFRSTKFTPPTRTSEVELADFVIQLDDLVMIFQVKEREEPSTDPEAERTWFDRKVIKKATQQIRDTVNHLRDCRGEIANDRGRRIALPVGLDAASVLKLVVFKGGKHLPVDQARHHFHDSRTAGFIHVIAAGDWAGLMNTLVTPREIADFLRWREGVCRAHTAMARSVSEKALVGQFLAEEAAEQPSPSFETIVDRLLDETASFDMLGFLNLFPDRITVEAPPGHIKPADMCDAGADYYPIVREIAKLPRTDLSAFKTRFGLAWQRAGKVYDPPFMRMVSSTGVGFVFAPVPEGLEDRAQDGLMNFVAAHMYVQQIRRCIGASFVNEGEWRFIWWVMLDQEWRHNPEMEKYLREHPISAVREDFVPRYRLQQR